MNRPTADAAREALETRAIARAAGDTSLWTEVWQPQIRLGNGKVETFRAYPFQFEVLAALDRGSVFINKGRQQGLSTIVCLQKLRRMIEVSGVQVLVISKDLDSAKHIKAILRRAYDSITRPDKPVVVRDNMTELVLSNGSGLQVEAATETAGRSLSITDLVIDEAAFQPHIEEIWSAAVPTIGDGGSIVVLSTPNGEGNWFHRMWMDLVDPDMADGIGAVGRGGTGWSVFRLPWTVIPGRDDAWRAKAMEKLRLTEMGWEQEFCCSFNASSETILRSHHVDAATVPYDVGVDNRIYVIAVDVAGGGERDESVISVIDVTERPYVLVEQDASAETDTVDLRKRIVETLTRYPGARVVIDHTGIGIGVSQALLRDDGVEHIGLTFTSGSKATWHGELSVNVPRQELLVTIARLFEGGHVRVPNDMHGMITALRTARWGSKRAGRYADRLDSLMMGLWIADNTEPETEGWMSDVGFLADLGITMPMEDQS